MSIKLCLLKSGETVICDLKEASYEGVLEAYVFNKPQKVSVQKEILLTEEKNLNDSLNREYQVMLSPWILLTNDDDIIVTLDWVVSVVEPVSSLKNLYVEKIGEQDN